MNEADPNRSETGSRWQVAVVLCSVLVSRVWRTVETAWSCALAWRVMAFLSRRSRTGRWISGKTTNLRFHLKRFAFAQAGKASGARIGSHAMWAVLRLALPPVVLAALAVALLLGLPIAYTGLAARYGWPIPRMPQVHQSSYNTLMGTVAQAASTVLAMSFAVIGVVAGATYAKLSGRIQAAMLGDDLNQRYFRLLAHTAAAAIACIGLRAVHVSGSLALAVYVMSLAGICILAFLPMGIHAFK